MARRHSHLFCGLVHPLCIALDGEFASDREVTYHFFLENYSMNSLANYSNQLFQDTEFDPLSLDRKGHPIDYQPPCLVSRMGSTAPSLRKLMKTHAAPTIITYQSSKRKVAQGTTQKTSTGKRLHRTRPLAAQVNNPCSSRTDTQLLIPFLHSYRVLHPNLLLVRYYYPKRLI